MFKRSIYSIVFLFAISLKCLQFVWAEPSITELKVSLFDQPCTLSGPYETPILQSVHALSPEQTPTPRSLSEAKKLLDLIKNTKNLPLALGIYQERLQQRTMAQVAFFEGLTNAKKSKKADSLTQAIQTFLSPRFAKDFPIKIKNTWPIILSGSPTALEKLTEDYFSAIEPHPEEEFHRVIGRIKIKYNCSFGESEGD